MAFPHDAPLEVPVFKWILVLTILMAGTAVAAQVDSPVPAEASKPAELPSVELPPALDRVLRDYEAGWRAFDADALAALFSDDGFVLRPGHPPVRGREAIAKTYEGLGGPLHLRALAFEQDGSVAYIIGGYRGRAQGRDSGKFVLALRRDADGNWWITADMDNGNR